MNSIFLTDKTPLTISDVVNISKGTLKLELSPDKEWVEIFNKGSQAITSVCEKGLKIYGITTGFGDSVDRDVSVEKATQLQYNLAKYHGCGLGNKLSPLLARAVMVCRLASLKNGFSGVRISLLERIVELLEKDIVPVIPEEGSVGASGDLTPLSYLAAVLYGEREVYYQGEIRDTADVYHQLRIEPIVPRPKETLCIMNGTSVMTAISCFAFKRAEYITSLSARITALASLALMANSGHFDDKIFSAKPFPGQRKIAQLIRKDLGKLNYKYRIQAPYSIRCAPHVIGVLADSLPWMRDYIQTELNSANDNPLIDYHTGEFLHGGNFYGGHIAFTMDSMKNAVANIADLLDRQFALLADYKTNNGLPYNLTGADDPSINHGFKALQIAVSSWTAEALQKTMPLTSFSRSTECHNQDKVSMGTIAARDCIRVIELTEQVCAATLFAFSQAVEIRVKRGELEESALTEEIRKLKSNVLDVVGFVSEDRRLDKPLEKIIELISNQHFYAEIPVL